MSDSDRHLLSDTDQLIESNPRVDRGQFQQVQKLLEKLKQEGVKRPAYGLRSPYDRRPLTRRRNPR